MECIDKDDLLDKIKPKCKEETDRNCRGKNKFLNEPARPAVVTRL